MSHGCVLVGTSESGNCNVNKPKKSLDVYTPDPFLHRGMGSGDETIFILDFKVQ